MVAASPIAVLRRCCGYILIALVALVVGLLVGQRQLIYHPSAYEGPAEAPWADELPDGAVPFTYTSDGAAMVGFYRPPQGTDPTVMPERLWLAFAGNGSRALMWSWPLASHPTAAVAFLDYPGYGACGGTPTQATILAASDQALVALAARWRVPVDDLARRTGVIGHSLGCAAALQLAERHPVRALVLVSPFTSLAAMAQRQFGWPLCLLLIDHYDNDQRLREIMARHDRPSVAIVHGADDALIPIDMGRALASIDPAIAFAAIPDADHDDIVVNGQDAIIAAMRAADATP